MRIAFIIGPFPSFSQTFVLNQITGLIDLGHDVDIFAKRPESDPEQVPDVSAYGLMEKTVYFGEVKERRASIRREIVKHPYLFFRILNNLKHMEGRISLSLFRKVIPFIGRGPYDVIHCHFGPNGVWALKLRKLGVIRGKIGTVFHGYDMSSFIKEKGRHAYAELFGHGDIFLPISRYWADYLVQLGCSKKKIAVHRMGIDTDRFQPKRTDSEPVKSITIMSVARLVEKKGLEYGILAVAEMVDEFPNLRYEITGDGPLRERLETLIEQLGLQNSVFLRGWRSQSEVLAMLKQSDILLVPSITGRDGDKEGIPVVLMEAMAMGLPVVGTVHSGIPELVQDGISGFLAGEKDTGEMAVKLRELAGNRSLMKTMGQAGRRYVMEHYDIKKLNRKLSQLYRNII